MEEVLVMEEEVVEEEIFLKSVVIVKKTRHTIDTCYKKHNFPPHFKFINQNHDQDMLM